MDRAELEKLDRESLVVRAQEAGIRRARVLTRPEVIDELLRRDPDHDEGERRRARGFFGRARDLLARVVERGLHLPDAADRLRSLVILPQSVPRADPVAVPTVTLAEIYAGQGHKQRAVDTLRRVLAREPEHVAARALLAKLEDASYVAPEPVLPPEPEIEPALATAETSEPNETNGTPASPTATDAFEEPVCIAIPTRRDSLYVWWRVSENAIREGRFVVRAVVVNPSPNGPSVETRDVAADANRGETVLRKLPVSSVVRVAVGVLAGDTFSPIAHSPLLERANAGKGGDAGLIVWTIEGMQAVSPETPNGKIIARAWDASRQAKSS